MIEKLLVKDYHKVIHLFEDIKYINSIRSHLERTKLAKIVYVDNSNNPKSAALFAGHRLYFGGTADNVDFNKEIKIKIQNEYIPFAKKNDQYTAYCHLSNNEWEEKIDDIIENTIPRKRFYYEIRKLKFKNWRDFIPDGYSVEPVNLTFLEKRYLQNYDWITEEIEESWFPFDEGLKETRGFILVRENEEIVSFCTTEYLTNENEIEVGIATRDDYQRKGLASIIGAATAEYCLGKYKSIGWHCSAQNIGSYKTAEKIGYKKIREYNSPLFWFNHLDNKLSKGYHHLINKNYEEALRLNLEAISEAESGSVESKESYFLKGAFPLGEIYFETASLHSVLGNNNLAFSFLEKAIELGFFEKDRYLKNELLKPLYCKNRWVELIRLVDRKTGEKD